MEILILFKGGVIMKHNTIQVAEKVIQKTVIQIKILLKMHLLKMVILKFNQYSTTFNHLKIHIVQMEVARIPGTILLQE